MRSVNSSTLGEGTLNWCLTRSAATTFHRKKVRTKTGAVSLCDFVHKRPGRDGSRPRTIRAADPSVGPRRGCMLPWNSQSDTVDCLLDSMRKVKRLQCSRLTFRSIIQDPRYTCG